VALRAEQPLTAIDLTGRPHELQPTQGEAYLTLNDTPLYVRGPVTSIGAADRFAIQPQQQVDIRQEAQVRFTVNGDAIRGQFRIDDRRLDIPGPGTYSLKLPEQPTDREGEQTYQYQLTLDGRLVGMGAVQLRVTDPLAFEASSAMISEGALHLVLRNESKETAYELQSVAWRIGEESQQQARVVTMPAAHELRMALPVAELRPYATAPARATVQLAGRSPVVFAGRVSYDPLPRHTATIDGDLSDWREAPAIDIARDMPVVFGQGACSGEARLAWDEKALQFAVNVGGRPTDADDFCFAVADASGEGAWYEFRAAMVNGKPQVVCAIAPDAARIGAVGAAQVKIQRTDEATVYELALPWSAIAPLTSAVPAVRVGMLIHSAGRAAQWGEGMYPGHDPRGLRLCQRISPKESVAQGAFNVEIRPLPTAAITPGPGRVIAHFADDYSNVQGRRNWYYGYYDGQGNGQGDGRPPRGAYTDDDFKPMTYTETVWGYEWGGPMRYLKISRDSMHPQASDGRPVWAVRRWKSDVQGTIRLSGKIAQVGEKKGDGVGLVALVDGRVVARWMIGGPDHPPSIPYQAETKVNVGSLVDLAVTPGPGINPDYDATSMTEQIELLP